MTRSFPYATLYMGALTVSAGRFADAEQVASAAAQAKRAARLRGVGVMVSDGTRLDRDIAIREMAMAETTQS